MCDTDTINETRWMEIKLRKDNRIKSFSAKHNSCMNSKILAKKRHPGIEFEVKTRKK